MIPILDAPPSFMKGLCRLKHMTPIPDYKKNICDWHVSLE